MLFNSFEFIFLFLPITLVLFFYISRKKDNAIQQSAIVWLIIASLVFYGWWKPINLPLIIFSMLVNYYLGYWMSNSIEKPLIKKAIFLTGIIFNLGLIIYFKYFVLY